jgi:hypothetical protein
MTQSWATSLRMSARGVLARFIYQENAIEDGSCTVLLSS